MQTKGIAPGFLSFDYEDFTGLIPQKRFASIGDIYRNTPDEMTNPIFEGLLEPSPQYCINNPKYPDYFSYLMDDITKAHIRHDKKQLGFEILLLSFEIKQTDNIDIVDRAHIEKMLYSSKVETGFGNRPLSKYWKNRNKNYFNTRVPALEYGGGFELPQFVSWDAIEFERLKVEWKKPNREIRELYNLRPFEGKKKSKKKVIMKDYF